MAALPGFWGDVNELNKPPCVFAGCAGVADASVLKLNVAPFNSPPPVLGCMENGDF